MPFFVLIFILFPSLAFAQAVCGPRAELVERLRSAYQEQASAIGLAGSGGVVELYTSEKGSWTLLLTQTTGVSCLIAAGDSWESLKLQDKSTWRDS